MLGEGVSHFQLAGLAVFLVALVLIISPKKSERISPSRLLFSALAMLGPGTNAVMQKIHQSSSYKDELMPFSSSRFSSLTFSLLSLIFLTRGGTFEKNKSKSEVRSATFFLLLGAIASAHDPLASHGAKMLIWGDRFLNSKKTGYQEYESSASGIDPAIDAIVKDILVRDRHYEKLPRSTHLSIFITKKASKCLSARGVCARTPISL